MQFPQPVGSIPVTGSFRGRGGGSGTKLPAWGIFRDIILNNFSQAFCPIILKARRNWILMPGRHFPFYQSLMRFNPPPLFSSKFLINIPSSTFQIFSGSQNPPSDTENSSMQNIWVFRFFSFCFCKFSPH